MILLNFQVNSLLQTYKLDWNATVDVSKKLGNVRLGANLVHFEQNSGTVVQLALIVEHPDGANTVLTINNRLNEI